MQPEIRETELRLAPRYPILQRCFVHLFGSSVDQAWRSIAYNISTTGIGLTLPIRLAEGSLVNIHPWGLPRARPLQARIVHARPVELFWFTGCELLQPLSEADIQTWQSGPLDWLDHRNP